MEKQTGAKRVWGWSRRIFRWFRIAALVCVLCVAGALLYLNRVGLPGFVKSRVVAGLEREGLSLQFSRLHLRGYRHVVIDDVRLNTTNTAAPIQFGARHALLNFRGDSLRGGQFQIESVKLENGWVTFDLTETNAPAKPLRIENVEAELQVDRRDRWTLRSFRGEALGARWNLSGSVTNLLALNRAKTQRLTPKANHWKPTARDILDTLERVEFSAPPQITIAMHGDLRELSTLTASASVRGPSAKTPWGDVGDLFFESSITPSSRPGEQMNANLSLRVKSAATEFGKFEDGAILAQTTYPLTNQARFESAWTFKVGQVQSEWFSGNKLDVSLTTRQAGTNLLTLVQATSQTARVIFGAADNASFQARVEHAYPVAALNSFLLDVLPVKPQISIPRVHREELLTLGQHWLGDWRLDLHNLRTRNGAAGKISFSGDVRERAETILTARSWGFWQRLAPLVINWRAEALDFRSGEAALERVSAGGAWNAPLLTIASMDSRLYGGAFHLDAALDVASRNIRANTTVDFDVKKIAWLLDPGVRPFLDKFAWQSPPKINGAVTLVAPPWVKPTANWRREMLRSAVASGSVAVGEASFRDVTCSSLSTDFALTNFQWHLPNIVLTRPEGALRMQYTGHAYEPEFKLSIEGGINPWAALPLLNKRGQLSLKFVEFTEPPLIEGTLAGNFKDDSKLNFTGNVAATNVIVRGQKFHDVKSFVTYSNLFIFVRDPIAHRTTNEVMSASSAGIDLKRDLMFLTNGFSTTDPVPFTKVIGRATYRALEPYRFKKPPVVRGEGIIPLRNERDANLRFQVSAEDFSYWRFNITNAVGGIHWHHQYLDVTNFTGAFYGGDMEFQGHFTFRDDDSADYRFKGVCTNANLALLLRDLLPEATNKLEGALTGTLVITEANSETLQTWKGHGEAALSDGFLWDIPIFGVLSGPLNAIAPGFGKSRISRGEGTFRIAEGKVHTDDMEVRAPAFRLKYDGSVDFEGNLDAKVEAQLLRDAWVFGKAVSALFWPLSKAFESQISGNLSAPKSELAHIPKVMLFPLRPIQTIKELTRDKDKEKEKADDPKPGPAPNP